MTTFIYSQGNGLPPAVVARGKAPGESGLSILHAQFADSASLQCVGDNHRVFFHLSEPTTVDCRVSGKPHSYRARIGTMGISPSGSDCIAESTDSVESLAVSINPRAIALAVLEDDGSPVEVVPRLASEDPELLRLACALSRESQAGYPNRPLFWHAMTDRFIDRLLEGHTKTTIDGARGTLSRQTLTKLRDYIYAHIDEPIEVAALASIACRSRFHFTRLLSNSIGVTPHQYVVHLRLKRAIELIREGGHSLAEVAVHTGFADQSHLTRWVRRVYGVSLRQLA